VATATVVRRAGIEGTFSQEVLKPTGCARPAAGPGEDPPAKLATAASMNVGRMTNWLNGVPTTAT
jgi:hypothetical protein